jgi:hypothetical protein
VEGHRVKVTRKRSRTIHHALGRTALVLTLSIALSLGIFVQPASALTRQQVLSRANVWVAQRVGYSQHSYFRGYRRDCSGFVSMAWRLGTSYSTRTISARARRIPISSLKPGDAVLKRGHVSLFGGWKNKRKRQYIAIEQTTWGSHAKRHVRTIPARAVGLRLKTIREARPVMLAASVRRVVPPQRLASRIRIDKSILVVAEPSVSAAMVTVSP